MLKELTDYKVCGRACAASGRMLYKYAQL